MRKTLLMSGFFLSCLAARAAHIDGELVALKSKLSLKCEFVARPMAVESEVLTNDYGNNHGLVLYGDYAFVSRKSSILRIELSTRKTDILIGSRNDRRVVDGGPNEARFYRPRALLLQETDLYLRDHGTIRKVNLCSGETTTLAGKGGDFGAIDGIGSEARLGPDKYIQTEGLALVRDLLYFIDDGAVRVLDLTTKQVSTVAGMSGEWEKVDGVGRNARFANPISVTSNGTILLIGDKNRLRTMDLASHRVATISAEVEWPSALYWDKRSASFRFSSPWCLVHAFEANSSKFSCALEAGHFQTLGWNAMSRQGDWIYGIDCGEQGEPCRLVRYNMANSNLEILLDLNKDPRTYRPYSNKEPKN